MRSYELRRLRGYREFPGPVVFAILDGVGIGARDDSDGVHLAYTPTLDRLFIEDNFMQLKAHGKAVGMPTDDDMGNSEVGHNTLGAGRTFAQGATLVGKAVADGRIYESEAWKTVMARAADGGTVHFIGLLSDGNVHSHINHLLSMLRRCAEENVTKVRVHALQDGRDVGERSALHYAEQLEETLAGLRNAGYDYRVASGGGRMNVTMDRYFADWSIVERGWNAHVLGEARRFASLAEAIQTYYDEDPDVTDQYLDSFTITENGEPVGTIEDGDSVVCFNFRGDRVLELTMAFEDESFDHFDRKRVPNVFYTGMMEYDGDAHRPQHFLVPPPEIDGTIGQYLCAEGVLSYAISETQKFGHVTYFWNGNNSGYIDEKLEKYVEITSDRVPFDQRPWMKAAEITDETIKAVESGIYKFIRLNYPNGDMVGHTGVPAAVRISVEAVDICLHRLIRAVEKAQGIIVIVADHGNADCMFTEKKGKREPMVAHTLNPVPFIVKDCTKHRQFHFKPEASQTPKGLSRVAATLMNLLGYEAPNDYDPSLVELRG